MKKLLLILFFIAVTLSTTQGKPRKRLKLSDFSSISVSHNDGGFPTERVSGTFTITDPEVVADLYRSLTKRIWPRKDRCDCPGWMETTELTITLKDGRTLEFLVNEKTMTHSKAPGDIYRLSNETIFFLVHQMDKLYPPGKHVLRNDWPRN